jgi:hypothetical protein
MKLLDELVQEISGQVRKSSGRRYAEGKGRLNVCIECVLTVGER